MTSEIREADLQIWQEIIGDCKSFRIKRGKAVLILRVHGQDICISFKLDSKEGAILRRSGRKLVGQKLGILRTDSEVQPIVLRVISKEESRV
jgi:hypothetical protein